MDCLLPIIRRTHWAMLVFVGAMLLQLLLLIVMASSSYWAHALVVYLLWLLLGIPVVMLVALFIEQFKKFRRQEARPGLAGLLLALSLLTIIFFLTLVGPLVQGEFVGSVHFNNRLYYVSGRLDRPDSVGNYTFDLYECNFFGFGCNNLGEIAEGSSTEFDLDLTGDNLEISYGNEVVYIID